ncbi:MAG: DNA mismatch repair protein MutT, partial [Mycobacterium sp.]
PGDVALNETTTLRAFLVAQTCGGTARAHDHRAVRWVKAAGLERLDWVPADRIWIPELTRSLTAHGSR